MFTENDVKQVLVIGIAGGLAQLLSKKLNTRFPNAKITGVDSRTTPKPKDIQNLSCLTLKYSRTEFEKLFRKNKFDVVFHLGRLSHAQPILPMNLAQKIEFTLVETQKLFDICKTFQVKKIIFLSSFHVYGANADNPVFLTEDAPLRASIDFGNLREVVEIDFTATNWMWKYQNEIQMNVFRPCNIIGHHIKNAVTTYLTTKYSPYPIDYNPSFQFIHEDDMANILVRAILEVPTGVYNLAPDEFISIRRALQICKNGGPPVPLFLATAFASLLKKWYSALPEYFLEYLKYPCLIDNQLIKTHLKGPLFFHTTEETLKAL